jgi:hypothetical protein
MPYKYGEWVVSLIYPAESGGVRAEPNVIINLLTPWSRILFEKLIVPQLVKKFSAL